MVVGALWSRIIKIPVLGTGPLTRPFPYLLAPLTHLLALPARSAALRSLVHLLTRFAHSLARGTVND